MENRVDTARIKVQERIDRLSDDARAKLESTTDITFDEHFQFQETQARFHAMEIINQEEALIVYGALGEVGSQENGGWAEGTDLATKIVVTQLMAELLALRLAI
ncbi:MAG TPA: hypothetical protein VFU96_02250 [Acidimicrobiia bacterium]|nr:hypothetical protein [Acidimicrobiia bacterium]